jgi:hypothetical protein
MTREQYFELRRLAAETAPMLNDPTLSAEARERLQVTMAGVAGALSSVWVPMDWWRRALMAGWLAIGCIGLMPGMSLFWLLAWIPLPLSSPRLVGEYNFAKGNLIRILRGG